LPARHATPANAQDHARVAALAAVQDATGGTVGLAYVDAGYTGDRPAAAARGLAPEVVTLADVKRGFVLLRVDGWWSAPSAGWRGSGGSPATTRASPGPSSASASSPSPSSWRPGSYAC